MTATITTAATAADRPLPRPFVRNTVVMALMAMIIALVTVWIVTTVHGGDAKGRSAAAPEAGQAQVGV